MKIKKLYAILRKDFSPRGVMDGLVYHVTLSEVSGYISGDNALTIETREVKTIETARRHAREIADMLGAQLIWED